MELAHRWGDRNLTRAELVMAILILALLIGYFSRHMFIVFGKVEKSMIDRTLININTALHYKASFSMMEGDVDAINKLVLMNPMDLMTNKIVVGDFSFGQQNDNSLMDINYITSAPSNYGGIVIDDSDPNLESGQWYFDQDDHILFFKLYNSEYFTSNIDGPARVRYKVRLDYIDQNNDNSFDHLVDKFMSVKLQAIDNFEWSF